MRVLAGFYRSSRSSPLTIRQVPHIRGPLTTSEGESMSTVTAPNERRIQVPKREAAEILGISVRSLDRLDIPRVRCRGRIMFRCDTLDAWSKSHEETPSAE